MDNLKSVKVFAKHETKYYYFYDIVHDGDDVGNDAVTIKQNKMGAVTTAGDMSVHTDYNYFENYFENTEYNYYEGFENLDIEAPTIF